MLPNLNYSLDFIAEEYVKLVLNLGLYDPYLVDAYSGPKDWKPTCVFPLKELDTICQKLLVEIENLNDQDSNALTKKRQNYLFKHLQAMACKIKFLNGDQFTFDQESLALYDAVAKIPEQETIDRALKNLEDLLPGKEALSVKANKFRSAYIIKPEYLADTFACAVEYCQMETKKYIELPKTESFTIEYINGQPWSAYNWFKGNSHSLIQVNTDLPIFIDRAIDLAAHEGYPGHHVYHSLLEDKLLNKLNWVEYYINPLFSPQSLIAEGTANAGIAVVIPSKQRKEFEENILYPKAGLDPKSRNAYEEFEKNLKQLRHAEINAARQYLDQKMSLQETSDYLMTYCLLSPERAKQRISFIERYRSYIINYTLGQDLVEDYLNNLKTKSTQELWNAFEKLLSEPCVASDLKFM
jgi:hypothetical protein